MISFIQFIVFAISSLLPISISHTSSLLLLFTMFTAILLAFIIVKTPQLCPSLCYVAFFASIFSLKHLLASLHVLHLIFLSNHSDRVYWYFFHIPLGSSD